MIKLMIFFMKPICTTSKYGTKEWRLNGKLHREDGPAVEYADGVKYWFYHGKYIDCKDNQEFLRIIKLIVFL
jgi:hypothetical protein